MRSGPLATSDSPPARREHRAVEELAAELAAHGAADRPLAIVLGSGLGDAVEALESRRAIPIRALEHLPCARVKGHLGAIVLGDLGGLPVVVQSGRVHLYEGRDPHETTRAVRAYARLGVRAVLLTNAAGSLVPDWTPGTLVRLCDHLDLQCRTTLARSEELRASPYDAGLGALLDQAAGEARVRLERGIYAGMLGPSYETPAEIRALRALGAQVVGMSTVAEASAARAAGLRVLALSCVANPAAGLGSETLRHEDVLAVMRRSAHGLGRILARAAPALGRALVP